MTEPNFQPQKSKSSDQESVTLNWFDDRTEPKYPLYRDFPSRAWNTSILEHRRRQEEQYPDELGYWEVKQRSVRELYDLFLQGEEQLGRLVSRESPIYLRLDKIKQAVAQVTGYAADTFEFDILRSSEVNACIIHDDELPKPHIFITTGILHRLASEYQELREGHVEMLLGHEMKHFQEGHYVMLSELEIKSGDASKDLPEIIVPKPFIPELTPNAIRDVVLGFAFSRDQELTCDGHGLRCLEKLGHPPEEGEQVLRLLAKIEKERSAAQREEESRAEREEKLSLLKWVFRSLVKTHPASDARVFRAGGTIRQLQIEENVQSLEDLKSRLLRRSPIIEGVREDADLAPTPVQKILEQLNGIMRECPPVGEDPLEQIKILLAEKSRAPGLSLEQIKHLTLVLPAVLRALSGHLPFEPFGYLREDAPDKFQALEQGLHDRWRSGLVEVINFLQHCSNNWAEQERAASSDDPAGDKKRTEIDFQAWIYSAAYWNKEPDRHFNRDILPRLEQDPFFALELIQRYGVQRFDLQEFNPCWLERMLESRDKHVRRRAESIMSVYDTGAIDLRGELIVQLLKGDILEGLKTGEQLESFVSKLEQMFANDPVWQIRGIDRILGQNIALWCEARFGGLQQEEKNKAVSEALTALAARETAKNIEDFVLVEASALMLSQESGVSFDQRKDWLEKNIPSGKSRDLLLFRLLEEETGAFGTRKDMDRNDASGDLKRGKETRDSAHTYVRCFEAIVPLLNLGWYVPQLLKGDLDKLRFGKSRQAVYDEMERDKAKQRERDRQEHGDQTSGSDTLLSPENSVCVSEALKRFVSVQNYDVFGPRTRAAQWASFYSSHYIVALDIGGSASGKQRKRSLQEMDLLNRLAASNCLNIAPSIIELSQLGFGGRKSDGYSNWSASQFSDVLINPISVACLSRGDRIPGVIDLRNPSNVLSAIERIPAGEFRDYIILTTLAADMQARALYKRIKYLQNTKGLPERLKRELPELQERVRTLHVDCRLFTSPRQSKKRREAEPGWNNPEVTMGLLALLSPEIKNVGSAEEVSFSLDRLARLEKISTVYRNYWDFLRFRCGMLPRTNLPEVAMVSLKEVANEIGRLCFNVFYEGVELERFNQLGPQQKLAEIKRLYLVESEARDKHLLDIMAQEKQVLSANGRDENEFYLSDLARDIYSMLYTPHRKYDLGRKVYKFTLESDPALSSDFDAHLQLILDTHPPKTLSRERALKRFFDGAPGTAARVRTWQDRDRVIIELERDQDAAGSSDLLTRTAGILLLEDAVNELDISMKGKVDTLLWIVGLKKKSHLVRCYEMIEGEKIGDLDEEAKRLSDDEKAFLLKNILAGPQGILRSEDREVRREFLDTLFMSVFSESKGVRKENLRYFKSVFDSMLHHIEPERAAGFLSNFLVSHLEGDEFNQQVKVFFESFGFVGIKTAQYLVSNTTLIPEDMKEVLLDLTSRVEGPDKRFVFDMAERIYGQEDARNFIYAIGNRVGGGSLMSFYEVELWSGDHSGPGRKGVVGILRPDIVQALPEDLHIVHRIIQTMQEAPEIFGGNVVTMDMMENLMWQSLVETDLRRTARLQNIMRQQVQDDRSQRVHASVPEVWDSRGPFIFMDHAPGVTLDIYRKQIAAQGEEGKQKYLLVINKIVEKFFDQLTQHGLVHCDLHPGNVLVHEYRDKLTKIEVTLLDVGLSTELSPAVVKSIGQIMRLAIGATDFLEGNRQLEGALKSLFGLGKVQEREGKQWIAHMLDLFEKTVQVNWAKELKDRATDLIWDVLNERDKSVQTKIAQISTISNELGFTLPREFYYILRAVSVMSHIWDDTDWSQHLKRLRRLGDSGELELKISPIDINAVLPKIMTVAGRLNLPCKQSEIAEVLQAANSREDLMDRLGSLRDGFVQLFSKTAAAQFSADAGLEFLEVLAQDEELRSKLGLDTVSSELRKFFDENAHRRAEELRIQAATFLAANPLPDGQAARVAYQERFGMRSKLWDATIYPGSVIRAAPISEGRRPDFFLVQMINDVEQVDYGETSLSLVPHAHDIAALLEVANIIWSEDSAAAIRNLEKDFEEIAESADGGREVPYYIGVDRQGDEHYYIVESALQEDNPYSAVFEEKDPGYRAYLLLQTVIDEIERTSERISLDKLIRSRGIDKLSIYIDGEWKSLAQLVIDEGETRTQYLHFLGAERERLSLEAH